jgi:hypothetical protein
LVEESELIYKPRKLILADHKKVGKRFIPPLAQIPGMDFVSWVKEIMPNVLWIALLNEKYGFAVGAELCVKFAKLALEVRGEDKVDGWFSTISAYSALSEEQKQEFVSHRQMKLPLEYYQNAFEELVFFYPECPLRFVFDLAGQSPEANQYRLDWFKEVLGKYYDRTSKDAMMVQGDVIYIGFQTKRLSVFQGSMLAELPALEEYPNSEKSRLVASGTRAAINGFIGSEIKSSTFVWSDYFWDRGKQLEFCEFI